MNRTMPEIRQVLAFVAIVDTGSFTLAAKRLHLTQSAISHSLRSLEDSLNTRLLDRKGKSHTLTASGEVFLRHCRAVLAELERALDHMQSLQQKAV
jgi:LysR family transcriptional regulator, low CO2-responsive transcriptional regulator